MKCLLVAFFILIVACQSYDINQSLVIDDFDIQELDNNQYGKSKTCKDDWKVQIKNVMHYAWAMKRGKTDKAQYYKSKIINLGIKMVFDCGLFCYQPSIKKCEEEHHMPCEKWGAIVYPECREGFTNWDCCICGLDCPSGFRDDGLYCAKPGSYSRPGYPLGQEEKCRRQHPDLGCEKWGALWYPKCQQNFHNVGCCVCSPNCPPGWEDIGVSCKKPITYDRGPGYAVTFGLKCLYYDSQNIIERVNEVPQEYKPQLCLETRAEIGKLIEDVEYEMAQDSQAFTSPFLSLLQEMVYYSDFGCIDFEETEQQQEQLN